MSLELYDVSVPIFKNTLENILFCLTKAKKYIEGKNSPFFDTAVLVQSRLAFDMYPLSKQIQLACDSAKSGVARMAEIESPKFENNETTFDELIERIEKTLIFINSVSATDINGKEKKEITISVGHDRKRSITIEDYLRLWSIPNFYFHINMIYAIVRHNGIDIGKMDYLNIKKVYRATKKVQDK